MGKINLVGKNFFLDDVFPEDISSEFICGLNDSRVNQFLECRFFSHTLESQRNWVTAQLSRQNVVLLGIFSNRRVLVGSIKYELIGGNHNRADVGFMLTDPKCWGLGLMTDALSQSRRYLCDSFGIEVITGGCYAVNYASARVFTKSGFVLVAEIPDYWVLDGKRESQNIFLWKK